jgi:hypothetical protein
VGDGGDELILEVVELGAVAELDLVLMLFFACVRELNGELSDGALGTNECEQEDAAGAEQRDVAKYRKNVH